MTPIRIQKLLSMAGVCSRRHGEKLIEDGLVRINGSIAVLGEKADPETDVVEYNGMRVLPEKEKIYIALNKPKGYVTSCSHPGERVVVDLVHLPMRLFPVGRLDKDSTGLLILTNDGFLHNQLSHPSFDHEKEYIVTVKKPIPEGALRKLAEGMPMMGTRTRPAKVDRMSPVKFRIVLQEGKNRQIRRMVRKVGNQVRELVRIRISNIHLGKLPEGSWRYIEKKEMERLFGGKKNSPPPVARKNEKKKGRSVGKGRSVCLKGKRRSNSKPV